jgi:hypothetical protein
MANVLRLGFIVKDFKLIEVVSYSSIPQPKLGRIGFGYCTRYDRTPSIGFHYSLNWNRGR